MHAAPSSLIRTAVAALGLLILPLPLFAQEASVEPRPAPSVTVATAAVRPLQQVVPVSGSLIARSEVLVSPHAGGYAITELNADIGDHVDAGEVLARIDNRTLALRVRQAEAALANAVAAQDQARSQVNASEAQLQQANQVLERARALRSSGTATQSALDESLAAQLSAQANAQSARDGVQAAGAALQQAQASLEVAQLDFENAEITAPVAGIVSDRNGQIGAIAATGGEPIYRLIEEGVVEVAAEVIETELVLLHPDDPATLNIAGLAPVTGHVRLIAPVVSPTTRLGEVRLSLDDTTGLRPGLYVGGRIVVADRTGLAVPVASVLRDVEGSFVLRLGANDTLERRMIQTGIAWDGWQEVTDGLVEGDEVVARAGAFFGDGDVIRPVREGAAE
ncbi:efflux RND transporter periplasmic adaptor subunit [Pararhodobacter zhoushanensis]|uniref:Efflux RND transporter periplasmic adaptor subunit n=1 Tax=Pararhodobacter zhoushanensis TaxID=2479545 RepID=A0ABT3GZG2_9RHOB|nr:efflux RND transporter periplasmic adaptor subunit [Pararhodobacter zhoushanensis]MCW1932863.1 efflux RND transporter periplasmic adaptor subunit [Pararhodobacter zhoushanensis]